MKNADNPTQINCAYACSEPIKINKVTEISDLYVYFQEQEEKGLFRIKRREEISEKEMKFAVGELTKDIKNNNLTLFPKHPMSVFIQEHFPDIWEQN